MLSLSKEDLHHVITGDLVMICWIIGAKLSQHHHTNTHPKAWKLKGASTCEQLTLNINLRCQDVSADVKRIFFNCYLADPRPTLGHSQGDSLANPMLITTFELIRPEGHREPRNEVGSPSLAEHLAGFEPGTFRFYSQHLNPLGHPLTH